MPESTRQSYERLISPHLGRLFRTACRLTGSSADAEDLVQDTCVAGCQNLELLAAANHPDRWLTRVLYNRFVDAARRDKRSPVAAIDLAPESPALASSRLSPERMAEQVDGERNFTLACSRLSSIQRALLSLRAEGYGLAEIEDITGIGRQVLRARLHRARLSLARFLEEQCDEFDKPPRLRSQS